ncbi:MAG: S-layer homology domain-containing protein [Cyanobacteria bacterium P01_D01_bin.115]
MVGNTVAAYTATLAILQAGGQVCWAQTGPLNIAAELNQPTAAALTPRFSWRLGRRVSPWATATVMSQSQQSYWTNRQLAIPASLPSQKSPDATAPPTATTASTSKETQLRQAIAPYLKSQQLILIPQGEPVQVLYSTQRGQRRVHQVVFRNASTGQRFQIHARLTLDATSDAALQQQLAESAESAESAATELTLTADHLAGDRRGAARGTFFIDAIAIVMAQGNTSGPRARPFFVPLRALQPTQTSGLLRVGLPGCDPALRPIFDQPRAQWALGEAVGHIAARAVLAGELSALMAPPHAAWQLQRRLVQQGIPIFAFDDVALDDPDFEAIQMVAIANVVRTMRHRDLSFRPATPITKAVLASALARLPRPQALPAAEAKSPYADVTANHWAAKAIQQATAGQAMPSETAKNFAPSKVVSKQQLWQVLQPLYPIDTVTPPFALDNEPARRRHLSRSLYPIVRSRLSS